MVWQPEIDEIEKRVELAKRWEVKRVSMSNMDEEN